MPLIPAGKNMKINLLFSEESLSFVFDKNYMIFSYHLKEIITHQILYLNIKSKTVLFEGDLVLKTTLIKNISMKMVQKTIFQVRHFQYLIYMNPTMKKSIMLICIELIIF